MSLRTVRGWRWAAWAVVGLCAAACAGSEAKDPPPSIPLSLSLEPGDRLGSLDSPEVPVTVRLANAGEHRALVNTRLLLNHPTSPHELTFLVLGPDAAARPFRGLVRASAESREWKALDPGRSAIATFDLAEWFDLSAPGGYSVQAVYENRQDAPPGSPEGLSAWKGTVASPVLRFERKK